MEHERFHAFTPTPDTAKQRAFLYRANLVKFTYKLKLHNQLTGWRIAPFKGGTYYGLDFYENETLYPNI